MVARLRHVLVHGSRHDHRSLDRWPNPIHHAPRQDSDFRLVMTPEERSAFTRNDTLQLRCQNAGSRSESDRGCAEDEFFELLVNDLEANSPDLLPTFAPVQSDRRCCCRGVDHVEEG